MNIQIILEFVIALALLIILHEVGHFLSARLLKLDVEEFGIGYPPRAMTLFTAKGTKYTLNWLPFGGFVRLKGETDPNVEGGFMTASPWKRIAVLVAGPLMNLLAAVIMYAAIISMIGMPQLDKVEVKDVAPNSPAWQAGMQVGDLILMLNETEINSTDTLARMVAENVGKETTLDLERNGEYLTLQLVPRIDPPEGEGAMGIVMGNPVEPVSVMNTLPAGVIATYEHGKALFTFVGQLIRGQANTEEARLVGFKGMYDLYNQTRTSEPIEGISREVNVIGYFTSITISLGLLNLLPFPALDGGRIVFALSEILLRKRIPPEYENMVNLIGFALLLLLLVYINLQDFIHPLNLP